MPMNFTAARNWSRTASPPAPGSFSLSAAIRGAELSAAVPNLLAYVDAPALSAAELPDGESVTYTLVECADPRLGEVHSSTILGVQVGVDGKGAAAATCGARPRRRGGAYIGLRVDASAGAKLAGLKFTLNWALLPPT